MNLVSKYVLGYISYELTHEGKKVATETIKGSMERGPLDCLKL